MKLIRIKQYDSLAEAELAKNMLESHDVKVMLRKDEFYYASYGGGDILVPESDEQKARDILGV